MERLKMLSAPAAEKVMETNPWLRSRAHFSTHCKNFNLTNNIYESYNAKIRVSSYSPYYIRYLILKMKGNMYGRGRGKRKDGEYASDDTVEGHAPPKKAPKTQSSDNSDDIVVCELSRNKRVAVRIWQGKVYVDIRECFVKDGKTYPGKKGIMLTEEQWNLLRDNAGNIDKALSERL